MNHRLRNTLSFFTVAVVLATASWAQWSSDPNQNLALSDMVGADQVQPKLAVLPDSSWYVSWFNQNPNDAPPQGYDTYIQRLNAQGVEQLPHNGVPVAILSNGSTEDYGLDIDSHGNALLAFLDTREGANQQVTAAKVAPNGQPLWGGKGVQVTRGNTQVYAPKITATSDGSVVVAWSTNFGNNLLVSLQKLDANGKPQWPRGAVFQGVVLGEANASYFLADLHAADNGSVIVSFVRETGFYGNKYLYANKISSTGKLLWGKSHVKVWDGGSLQFGNFPPFLSDGNGGAIFAWYSSQPTLQTYVQHIRADGSEAFPHNGVPTSTNANQLRLDPGVSYRGANGDIFVFWTEWDAFQTVDGIYAQRIDSTGTRQWGDNGLEIVPLGNDAQILPQTVQTGDGVLAFWFDQAFGYQNGTLQAIRLNQAGQTTCSQFPVSSIFSPKGGVKASIAPSGLAAAVFQDYRNGNSDIYIQNVNSDCSLGPQSHLGNRPTR